MKASVQALTLWGEQAPAHCITAILIMEDQRTIVTGSQEGPLCLWNLSPELQISSKQILLGHTASVTCLAKARDFEKQPYAVSATENGEMCIWDVTSGQCVEHTQLPFRHTAICYFHSSSRMRGDGWLLCCGQYHDVLLIDAKTLAVLHTLTSLQSSDWISCMCLVHSPRIQEDSLIAVSASGDLKVWDLSSSVTRIQEKQLVTERESKSLDCPPCHTIRFCTYTQRLLLAVFPHCWKVYDYCDFSLLWTETCPDNQSWAGGEVLAAHRLVLWTEAGQGYIYQLQSSCLSRSKHPSDRRLIKEAVCPLLLCSTAVRDNESFSYVTGFMNERKEPFYKILYSGDASGRITLWHIPDVPVSTLDGSPKEIPVAASWTLQDHFDAYGSRAEGVCGAGQGGRGGLGSSLYIPSLGQLVCGREDGRIVIAPALQAVRTRLLEEASLLKGTLPHRILTGHSSSVTSLLYLRGWSARFDPSWLVSGSQDSCVIWWDMFTGEMLHWFSLQAGPVTHLLLSSENYRFKGQRVVCCLCRDHSVALLHLQERAIILHARKHLSPVRLLRWHPLENLLVVGCENDSVSVWDIETGILERQETGGVAKAILAGCEDSPLPTEGSLLPIFEDDTDQQKNAPGGAPSGSCKPGTLSSSSLPLREKPSHRPSSGCQTQWPFTILPMKTKREDRNFHVLLFDLENLTELLRSSQLRGLKPSNSLHICGDALERAKSTAEKGTLLLRRNKTTGALSPSSGPGEEPSFGDIPVAECLDQGGGLKRQKKAKSSKKKRHQPPGKVDMNVVTDSAKLLLACLLPWGVDRETDNLCVQHLGISRLLLPVSFGQVSKENHLSLMLPGWSHTNSPLRDRHSRSAREFPSKVLDLRDKYLSAAQEPTGKPNGRAKSSGPPEGPPTLISLLNRMCFVKKIISLPLDKSSTQKVESVRAKWRATQSAGTTSFAEEPSEGSFGFPVENISLVKLISCWRDQSIEVVEAMQAALLAEVQRSMRTLLPNPLANGHGPVPAAFAKESKRDPSATELPEGPKSCWSSLAATAVAPHDTSSSPELFPGGEDVSDEQNIWEGTETQGEKKPNPWMSKVCSCKMC